MQNKEWNYIDKTKCLQEGIDRFPSIYIEGNAAIGKSTAVRMLLNKYPEIEACVLDFSKELESLDSLLEKLLRLKEKRKESTLWIVAENIPASVEKRIARTLAEMVFETTEQSKIIFVSREKPQLEFLELLWKSKLELISMEKLLFTQEEVRMYAEAQEVTLSGNVIYEKTGGWAGCVSMLLRLAKADNVRKSVEELLDKYEMKSYIQNEMICVLGKDEQSLLSYSAGCPWINEEMLRQIWGIQEAEELLDSLCRKGFLLCDREKKRWKVAPLFLRYIQADMPKEGRENVWYEKRGHIAEALWCLKKAGAKQPYQECVLRNYEIIYGQGLLREDVLEWNEDDPVIGYLKGIYYYTIQKFENLKAEIVKLEKIQRKTQQQKELLLNLSYLNQEMALTEWLELLEEYSKSGEKFKLYQMLGNSVTYLCGLRDLAGLFACEKKEEKQRARLWKLALGEQEWKGYQLAKIDYYIETERQELLKEEDWQFLSDIGEEEEVWQFRLAKLYLLCKLQTIRPEDARTQRIYDLEKALKSENHSMCAQMTEAISSLYAPWYGARERMSKWLRYNVLDNTRAIDENNFLLFYCSAQGCILLNQYERAEKILKKLVPYMQMYHRQRFVAELLFQSAVVNWGKELKGQAVKNTIESFLLSTKSRYVRFYAGYGAKGRQVLEAFIEWQQSNSPESWSRKKKYNYGNILTMPIEDYMQVIIRTGKKAEKVGVKFPEEYIPEHLTMMETIILQDIGCGMSNAQICQALELKLPTVKGHIYSLFKKLGVNSRMQAVVKGRELGILE